MGGPMNRLLLAIISIAARAKSTRRALGSKEVMPVCHWAKGIGYSEPRSVTGARNSLALLRCAASPTRTLNSCGQRGCWLIGPFSRPHWHMASRRFSMLALSAPPVEANELQEDGSPFACCQAATLCLA